MQEGWLVGRSGLCPRLATCSQRETPPRKPRRVLQCLPTVPGAGGAWPPLPAHMAFLPRTLPTPQLRAFALALPLPLEESPDHLHFLTPWPQLKSRLTETFPAPLLPTADAQMRKWGQRGVKSFEDRTGFKVSVGKPNLVRGQEDPRDEP